MTTNQVSKKHLRNPYVHRGAIKDARSFFGRVEETRGILGCTTQGQSVSIVAPGHIGKTSLLLHLRRSASVAEADADTGARHLYVFLDCQRKYEAGPPDIYQWMWSETLKETRRPGELPATVESAEEFEGAIGKLCATGFELTLLLDEFELMAANPQLDIGFFSHLRSLTVTHPVSFVTISRKRLLDLAYSDRSVLGSPFFNIFDQQRLGFLRREEARNLILEQVQGIEDFPAYTQEDLDFLFEVAGYHPAFLEIACYCLFEQKVAEEEWSDQSYREVRREYRDEVGSHFRYAWGQLTPSQRKAMMLVCKGQRDLVSDQLWTQLEHQCLVYGRKPFSLVFKEFALQEGIEDMIAEERVSSIPTEPLAPTRASLLPNLTPKEKFSRPVLDLYIGVLALITIAALVLSALFRLLAFLYVSAISLVVVVILVIVKSLVM